MLPVSYIYCCAPRFMNPSILFIALFWTAQVVGQPVQKIKELLKDKEFVPLNSYITKPQKSNVAFGWEILRYIVEGYQEGIIKIEENVPANDGTGGSYINNYRVYLLANKDKVFYYKFIKTVYKNTGSDNWEKTEETIDSLTDKTEYALFKNSFRQTYGDTFDHNDLFLTSIVYGAHCGFAGTNPEYMEKLNFLLLNNGVAEIRQWLKSANAEKQLYAIRGYRILINQGYAMTNEEKRIIHVVEQKKGTVSTCSGCFFMNETFQNVVSKINSIPTEYLKPENASSPYPTFEKKGNSTKNNWSNWWVLALGIASIATIVYFIRRTKKGGLQK